MSLWLNYLINPLTPTVAL